MYCLKLVWLFGLILQVLARKAKNQYTWKGFGAIPAALKELKVNCFVFTFLGVNGFC
jgi:hypothetical protein